MPENERLFKMFHTRPGWRSLPTEFLRELVERLGTKEDVIKFVIFAERYGLLTSNFKAIADWAEADPKFAVDQAAVTLTSLGNHLGGQGNFGEAEPVFKSALRINPEWPGALYGLALVYYNAGRYGDAIPVMLAQMMRQMYQECLKRVGRA